MTFVIATSWVANARAPGFVHSLDPYILNCAQDAFNERVKCWKTWKDAEVTLDKKREAKVRLELAHKMDKVPGAKREIKEVRSSSSHTFTSS